MRRSSTRRSNVTPKLASSTGLPTKPLLPIASDDRANFEAFRFDQVLGCLRSTSSVGPQLSDANYQLLKTDPRHPSLHFKKVGRYWSVRVGIRHRALAVEVDEGYL